jgi:hypothetical protein
MAKKKVSRTKRVSSQKPGRTSLKKALPPPDNPLLRAEADRLAHGGDAREMARARAKALQKKE